MFSGNFDEFCHKCAYSKDDLPNIDNDIYSLFRRE